MRLHQRWGIVLMIGSSFLDFDGAGFSLTIVAYCGFLLGTILFLYEWKERGDLNTHMSPPSQVRNEKTVTGAAH